MGDCPPGMTLERIKNELGYFKENCKWATRTEQNRNKSNNRYMMFEGVLTTIAEVAEKTGIKAIIIYRRLNRGWPDHDAVTVPVGGKRPSLVVGV